MDAITRGLLHALQIDGRAPLRRIAAVLGTSEHTVARRYRALRESGAARVVGGVDGQRLGYASWTIRVRCTPDAAIAAALARRTDTYWVHEMAGGTEVSCFLQAPAEREGELLAALPRSSRVREITVQALLHGFAVPGAWAELATLTADQVDALRPEDDQDGPAAAPAGLEPGDEALLATLAADGRTGYPRLAAVTRWSESTVRRRMAALRRAGVLRYQLDLDPAALGYRTQARLWLSVPPGELADTGAALAGHPEAWFVAATTGATNLVASVVCRDQPHLYRYLTDRIGALPAVRAVETTPVMRTVKRISR